MNRLRLTLVESAFALLLFVFSVSASFESYYLAFDPIHSEELDYEHLPISQRRSAVIEGLKNHAERTQGDAEMLLYSLYQRGLARNIRSVWIANIIRFDVDTVAISLIEGSGLKAELRRSFRKPAELSDPFSRPMVPSPGDSLPWGVELIGAPSIWSEYGLDGSGVLVALLDSGVDFGNADLADALWFNTDEIPLNGLDDDGNGYIDDYRGYDWTEDDPFPFDERGHGTHVAGTIGGRGVGGIGTGIAPGCTIMPLKIIDSSGNGEEPDVWEAIGYALEKGAQVMNFSIGWRYSGDPDRATWRAVVEAACAAGVVMCIAAGNENGYSGAPNNLRTPGDVPRAITVGATTISDERADFSSLGPVDWSGIEGYWDYPYPPGLIKPDVAAPGDSIVSCVNGGEYEYWNGTSMACPHVTGTVALLLQMDPSIGHDSVKTLLENSAVDLGPAGKDSLYGSGRIDLPALFAIFDNLGWVRGYTQPGARVWSDGPEPWVLADPSGEYLLKIPEGSHMITADAFNFESDSAHVIISAGDTAFLDLYLSAGTPVFHRFAARDFDTGDPISNVVITFVDWPSETLETGLDGRINETIYESDPAEILACKPGYISGKSSINDFVPDTFLHVLYLHRAEDFEPDSLLIHWGTSESGDDDWEWGNPIVGPEARSGDMLWATRLDTTYSNSTDSWLFLGEMDLSGEVEAPMLAYWQWFELEATGRGSWDGGNIKASTSTGPWEILFPEGGYTSYLEDYNEITGDQPGFSGEFSRLYWHEVRIPLEDYIGHNIDLAIQMGSDDNTVRRGWYIDDLALLPRTKRGPIFRFVSAAVDSDSIAISGTLFAVSDSIDLSSCFVHYMDITEDSILFEWEREVFSGHIIGPFTADTIRLWFSAEDIFSRRAVYPPGAPDSFICITVEPDTVTADTISPVIRRWAYWPMRSPYLDSTSLVFIIRDDSPVDSRFQYEYGAFMDSLEPSVSGDTLHYRIPVHSFEDCIWQLAVIDSAGNSSTDGDTIHYDISITHDFTDDSGPMERLEGSGWHWEDHLGWVIESDSAVLDSLLLPLFEHEQMHLSIIHRYSYGMSGGGLVSFSWIGEDSLLYFESGGIVPPSNPFFPGFPGFASSADTIDFASVPVNEMRPAAMSFVHASDSDSSFWVIEQINLEEPMHRILEKPIPEKISIKAFPNPFNSSCRIAFSGQVMGIEIIDITGRTVRDLDFPVGQNSIIWDGRDNGGLSVPTGVYLVRAKGSEIVRKTLYIK